MHCWKEVGERIVDGVDKSGDAGGEECVVWYDVAGRKSMVWGE
jgi:hypothetical protein